MKALMITLGLVLVGGLVVIWVLANTEPGQAYIDFVRSELSQS